MNDNVAERLLGLIRTERDAAAHPCDCRVDHALTIYTRGPADSAVNRSRRAVEDAASDYHRAQTATTDTLATLD